MSVFRRAFSASSTVLLLGVILTAAVGAQPAGPNSASSGVPVTEEFERGRDHPAPPVSVASSAELPFADAAAVGEIRRAAVDPTERDSSFAAATASIVAGETSTVLVQLGVDWNPADPDRSATERATASAQVAGLVEAAGGTVVSTYDFVPAVAVTADLATIEQLRGSPAVRLVEPEIRANKSLSESVPMINADLAQAAGWTGLGQTVAVLDDGFQTNHPFLGGRVVSEACYTTDASCPAGTNSGIGAGTSITPACGTDGDHGTHVAGIAAGNSGVAPDADLLTIDIFDACAGAATSSIVSGLERVRALVGLYDISSANLSLGNGVSYSSGCDNLSPVTTDAVRMLMMAGVPTVVASGNEYHKDGISWPACINDAVAVGAVSDTSGTVDDYSNSGPPLDLLAPGSWITSSVFGSGYDTFSGTSMAAPHVAGAFAQLRQWLPTASVTGLVRLLQQSGSATTDINGVTRSLVDVLGAAADSGAIPRPPNDDFANATPFTNFGGSLVGDNESATTQAGEPNHVNNLSDSVWYKYNAPRTARLVVTTGGGLDTVMAAYSGPSLTSLTPIVSNDDYAGVGSRVVININAGTTYWFAVDGKASATDDFSITWRLFPRNDYFASAIPMGGWSGGSTSFNDGASFQPGEQAISGTGGHSVWWRWTAPTTGRFIVNTNGSNFDTVLSGFRGTSLSSLTLLATNDQYYGDQSRVVIEVTAGATYYFAVDGWSSEIGNIGLNWRLFPKNDYFPSAVAMGGTSGSSTSWNFNASLEPGEPSHGGAASHSVWWRYTAPFNGTLTVNTNGSLLDTELCAYWGYGVDFLFQEQCNNNFGSSTASRVSFPVFAGETYYFAVDGVGSQTDYIAINWSMTR